VHVEDDVRFTDELDVDTGDGLELIPCILVLDPVSKSFC